MYEAETLSHSAVEKEAQRYRDYVDSLAQSLELLKDTEKEKEG